MYLARLEVQGFKTFAQKTVLEFPAPKAEANPLTVVVGPNGSGKSNLADAIRWCLGEQSMKQLRGKKTEDVIFSGSEGKSRSGFAEVSLVFNNEDKVMKVDYAEVTMTRRLYRDGESAYLLNGQETRLADIQLLLAEAGVGQRSYSVIGQGMIDHVLTSSPEERKVFFDDATGVRGLQMRRHQAMLRLEKSAINLAEVEMLLGELEPRLNLLRRQVKRLSDREKVEKELREVSQGYYGTLFWNLKDEQAAIERRVADADAKVEEKKKALAEGDAKLTELEKTGTQAAQAGQGELQMLQSAYKQAQENLNEARKEQFAAEREVELAKVRAQSSWAPLPLPDIISEVRELSSLHERVLAALKNAKTIEEVRGIEKELEGAFSRSQKLHTRLVKPNPDDFAPDPASVAAASRAKEVVKQAETAAKTAETAMDTHARQGAAQQSEVFAFQRELRKIQAELMTLENARNKESVDLARVETRADGLAAEMRDTLGADFVQFIEAQAPTTRLTNVNESHEKILRLRHQLEVIGSIDEDVIKEHGEVEERFTFLSTQVKDIREAIISTEKIIDELDDEVKKQSEKSFKLINTEFQKYFKVLFNGGSCSLIQMTEDEVKSETKVTLDRAMEDMAEDHNQEMAEDTLDAIRARVAEKKDLVAGVDIQATPPGKRLKSLNLLSGGERALTSIALLSAIMATNPSPFVVLDEVDAALDEANTVRFANILGELCKHTQFIVISHNRATMEKADTLYGVTMGDDGISKLLSVKFEDIDGMGSARR